MKQYAFLLCLLLYYGSHGQQHFTGLWYSKDGTRIYKIYTHTDGYEAVLHHTERKAEQPGALVLTTVKPSRRNGIFSGIIKSVSDGMPLRVKLRVIAGGRVLRLTLRRLFIIPVHFYWYRTKPANPPAEAMQF